MKDIGQAGYSIWECEAVTLMEQTDYPQKVFVLMRIRLAEVHGERFYDNGEPIGVIQYRLGYYTIARNGRWWWGQYAMMIPREDFAPLLRKAREEGTLLE